MIEIKFTQCHDIVPPEEFEGGYTHYMLKLTRKTNGGWLYAGLMPRAEIGVLPEALLQGAVASETVRAVMTEEGKISVFRLNDYLARLDVQAKRMGLPTIDTELTSYGTRQLLSLTRPYLAGGEALIHITLVSCETDMSIYPAKEAVLTVTVQKVQKKEMKPVTLALSSDCPLAFSRRYAKTTVFAVREGLYEAKKRGVDNVIWLDSVYHRYIDSLAGMDIFFRIGDGIYHAGDGFFSDSVRRLMESWGIVLNDGRVSVDFIQKEYKEGRLTECFALSAVCGIQPVASIDLGDTTLEFTKHKLTKKLYDTVNGIIYCNHPDTYNWILKV